MAKGLKNLTRFTKDKFKSEYFHFSQLKSKTGIPWKEYLRLNFSFNGIQESMLLGKKIKISDSFWHLHSLKEIFIDETYKFESDRQNPLIIDCGSNIGLSIIYFKLLYPNATVIGYEPDPVIFGMLNDNLEKFGFSNVMINNKAVWTEHTELKFNASGALGGTLNSNNESNESLNSKYVKVKTERLKNILEQFSEIDFLKIDIEGAEIAVLKDCEDYLHNVKNIFIEYHRLKGQELYFYEFLKIIEKAGFRIYIKEAWNNLPTPFMYKNFNPFYDLQLNIFGYKS